jgi:acylaminoacyl-peptidase
LCSSRVPPLDLPVVTFHSVSHLQKMTHKLQNEDSIDEYAQLCSYASSYLQGWVQNKPVGAGIPLVTVVRSSRGIDEDRPRASLELLLCSDNKKIVKLSSQSLDVAKPVVFDMSPSGDVKASLYNTFYGSSGAKEEKSIIEIGSDFSGSYRIDVTNLHGTFMGDSWFGGSSWSADDRYFAYVAVAKVEKPQTFFGSQCFTKSTGEKGDGVKPCGSSKYNYTEDWGERFGGIGPLGLYVLDVGGQRVHKIGDIDVSQWTVGQPCLITKQNGGAVQYMLGYTAFSNLPRKLGLFSCFQRPHSLFVTDITAMLNVSPSSTIAPALTHYQLSAGLKTARSLRCSPDGSTLVFLGQEKGFEEHSGCSELFTAMVDDVQGALAGSKVVYKKVVAQVEAPAQPSTDFPGLFCEALPVRCFAAASKVVLNSQWGSDTVILTVDISSGEVQKLHNAGSEGTAALLDVSDNLILYAQSTPVSPPVLHVYDSAAQANAWSMCAPVEQAVRLLRASASGVAENLNPNAVPVQALKLLHGKVPILNWKVYSHTADNVQFESILIYPNSRHAATGREDRGVPVVLVPHGGPHSVMTTAYFHAYAFLAHQLGSAVLHVNYRGSPGFGQTSIHSLPGTIGINDVADMMAALNHALTLRYDVSSGEVRDAEAASRLPLLLDAQRVSVVGGSHGGFLAGHLIGQHPEVFKAAAMRNPVTNIPAMYSVSDIPGKSP